jgi:hypothetical protein
MRCAKLTTKDREMYDELTYGMALSFFKPMRLLVYSSLEENDEAMKELKEIISKKLQCKHIATKVSELNASNSDEIIDNIMYESIWEYSRNHPEILHDYGIIQCWEDVYNDLLSRHNEKG